MKLCRRGSTRPAAHTLIDRTYAVARQAGGLEGLRPSKNLYFLVVCAGVAGTYHQKMEILGRPGALWASPQTPPPRTLRTLNQPQPNSTNTSNSARKPVSN